MSLGEITTHEEDAKNALLSQYRGLPNIEALVGIFAKQVQAVEDVLCDLFELRKIDNAFGGTLDNLGIVVGQDRQGFSDTFYRNLLKAKIGENTSQGDIDKIIDIAKLLTGADLVHLDEYCQQSFSLSVDVDIDPTLVNFFYERLNRVDMAGVRFENLICFDPAEGFAFAGGPGTADGFGDLNDANEGGVFAKVHNRTQPAFSFAAQSGVDDGDEGFGDVRDSYAGGILQSI